MTGDPGPIGRVNVGAACAIFDGSGRVLLVRHTYGRRNWELPGGIALPGEPPSEAAARELEEETGLTLAAERLAGVYFEAEHSLGPMLHVVFRFAWLPGGEPAARPPEIGDVGWFALDALPAPISDFTEARIADATREGAAYRVIHGRTWRD